MCSHIPLGERENSDSRGDASKVVIQKRRHRKYRKRSIPRTEKFGDLTTAEHKPQKNVNLGTITDTLSWYKVLATQWNPCKTKTSQKTENNSRKFTETVAEAKCYSYVQFIRIWQALWRIIMESSKVHASSLRDKQNCRMSCTSSKEET